MKSFALTLATFLCLVTEKAVAAPAPLTTAAVACPLYLPAPFADPFEAEKPALSGWYLAASNGKAVLVNSQILGAFTYSSSGPVGLWNSAGLVNGCPGYGYLNVDRDASLVYQYAPLKWSATATTSWNATVGGDLTKLGVASSNTFIACRSDTSTSSGYSLFIKGVGTLPTSLADSAGSSFVTANCIQTKIAVTASPYA